MPNAAFPLKYLMLVFGSATSIGLMLMLTYSVQRISADAITRQIGQTMAVLADQIQNKIDLILLERYQDLATIATLVAAESPTPAGTTALLERSLGAHVQFTYLGLLSADQHVVAEAGDVTAGRRVRRPDWLTANASGRSAQRPGIALLAPADAAAGTPPSFGLATPVRNVSGEFVGVAVAVAGWDWAQSITSKIATSPLGFRNVEALILSSSGRLLYGTAPGSGDLSAARSYRQAKAGEGGSVAETGSDGIDYVTGFASARSERFFGEPGIVVLVRQRADEALQPLAAFNRNILLILLLFVAQAVALTWVLTQNITAPLLQLASAASRIGSSDDARIPHLAQYAEVKMLSEGLIALVDALEGRQAALRALSTSLEEKVRERTTALEERNLLLSEATQRAERATAAKSRLLAAASHDLRQPLHALNLFCLALGRRIEQPEAVKLVQQIERSLTSLKTMLDKLLHTARLDSGLVVPTMMPVNVRDLVERIGAEFVIEADQRHLRYDFRSADCHARTDPALLETILRNLLANAFKFTRSGGILLAARNRGNAIAIEIYDTGPGIAPDALQRIFLEFERSAEQATGTNEGLGLGLSIVERHAALIGARLSVCSVPGKGSRFTVGVERCAPPAIEARMPATPAAGRMIDGVAVLLLDDNRHGLEALRQDLGDRGATVEACDRVEQAMATLARGTRVDAAVVDFDLAGTVTGLQFLDRCRRAGYDFPAMILTGRTDNRSLDAIRHSGYACLTKPADPDAVAAAIARMARRSRPPTGPLETELRN